MAAISGCRTPMTAPTAWCDTLLLARVRVVGQLPEAVAQGSDELLGVVDQVLEALAEPARQRQPLGNERLRAGSHVRGQRCSSASLRAAAREPFDTPASRSGSNVACSTSDIQVLDLARPGLDEVAARLDLLAHQRREDAIGLGSVVDLSLQQRARRRAHGRFPELLGVHLAQALEALDATGS